MSRRARQYGLAVTLVLLVCGLAACTAAHEDGAAPKCPNRVDGDRDALAAQAAKGPVRVIVGLRVDHMPGGVLDPAGRRAQLESIRAVQRKVISALEKGGVQVIERYDHVPSLALEVTAPALERLLCLPEVASVHAERRMRPR